ncbi:MAG: hypothetical protein GY718_18185, partial [Lentisphaerae bacterium]|nr:hypothetical protein [Lentisphaerota bacterium]
YIPRWEGFGYDDAFIGYLIKKLKFPVYELSYKWNHMQMFSEPWNDNANRFDSYVIHYAGAARFPDDKSGRTDLTNALSGRIELIKSDMDRITDGLMTFKDAKPTKKQGHGSVTYECKYGIQEMDVILKVSNTEECFLREKENQGKGIPNAVRIFGTANDPQVGHFIMLEKLHPLPDEIDDILILKIASKTLETLRYCYLNDITWIPKLDHIMLNGDGEVRIIDFGDDPYEKIPFFGDEEAGIEGILMDGECDKDGNYTMRYTYPLSGFRAIMQYLIDKHSDGRLSLRLGGIEYSMIAREYQSLKDVHQPINYAGLNGTFRTETEPADPDFGKLVPANRACVDRAAMLTPHLPSSGRWLDIGCNVGWFQFEFCNILEMVGVERDKEKVRFAQMIYDLYYSGKQNVKHVDFHEGLVDLKYVDNMPSYDIISAFSVLHLKLVADKDKEEFWILLEGICSKVKDLFFFEFPPHSYALAGVANTDQFIENVQLIGKFRKVEQIGKTDAGRPMLKCQK